MNGKKRVYKGRHKGGKLTRAELLIVGRQLRDAAVNGDVNAALALSNFQLVEVMSKQPERELAA